MFNLFKSKTPNIIIHGLGEFKYFEDKIDRYWELVSKYIDNKNSIEIDFLTLSGTSSEVDFAAKNFAIKLINQPNKLWGLVNDSFFEIASKNIKDYSKESVKENFYIKSLTIKTENFFEVGFHAYKSDIFIELFVKEGNVYKIEKDYDCCE